MANVTARSEMHLRLHRDPRRKRRDGANFPATDMIDEDLRDFRGCCEGSLSLVLRGGGGYDGGIGPKRIAVSKMDNRSHGRHH